MDTLNLMLKQTGGVRGMTSIQPGRYRHYKGKEYTVIGVARHSETQEELVVYRQEYGDHGLWVRPKKMFLETVEVEGRQVPRNVDDAVTLLSVVIPDWRYACD